MSEEVIKIPIVDLKISEYSDLHSIILQKIKKGCSSLTVNEYKFKVFYNPAKKCYCLNEDTGSLEEIEIYEPKTVIISGFKIIIYNLDTFFAFLEKKCIQQDNIYYKEKQFNVYKIFSEKEKELELFLGSKNKEESKTYQIMQKPTNSKILKSLVKQDKNYIDYNDNSELFINEERNNFINDIYNHNKSEGILYIYGPSGIGKTVTLLLFRYYYKNTLYLNLKYIFHNLESKKIYDSVIDELSFMFSNNTNLNNYVNSQLDKVLKSESLYDGYEFFCKLLEKIIKTKSDFLNVRKGEMFIVIDQYQSKFDSKLKIKNILNNSNDIVSVICSSTNQESFRVEFGDIFFQGKRINKIKYVKNFGTLSIPKLSINKLNLVKELGDLPKYIEEINRIEEDKINEYRKKKIEYINKKINKFLLNKTFGTTYKVAKIVKEIIQYENTSILANQFQSLFRFLPLKYFIPIKIEQNNYKYNYSFPLIKQVLESIINDYSYEINKELLEESKYSVTTAWNFEFLIQNHFALNTKPFNDLEYYIKSKIEINSIFDLKEIILTIPYNDKNLELKGNDYIYKINSKEDKNNFIKTLISLDGITDITQKPFGESYDGGLLIPIKQKNTSSKKFDFLLYQATLDRPTSSFISREEILKNIPQIKRRFETCFDITINNFYFIYILNFQRKGMTNVEKLCNYYTNKLYFAFYDSKDDTLKNKNNQILKWNLIKDVAKIGHLSEEYNNFNKYTYMINLSLNDAYENISNLILKNEKGKGVFPEIDDKEKEKIKDEIKITANSFLNKEIDVMIGDKAFTKKKTKREEDKNEKPKIQEEKEINNKIKKINDFLPKELNKFEMNYIYSESNIFFMKNEYEETVKKILKITKTKNLKRGLFLPICLYDNDNIAIIYFNTKKEQIVLSKYSKTENEILFYDMKTKNLITPSDELVKNICNPYICMNEYISYLFEIL